MTPGAFAAVVAFLFAPALMLAWPVQFWFFRRGGLLQPAHAPRVVAAALLMPLGGLVIAALAAMNLPPELGRWLGIHDVAFFGRSLPVAPLPFVSIALAGAFSTCWALRSARVRPPVRPKGAA